jgi:hypothetical protein
MFMPNYSFLIRDRHDNVRIVFQNDALASQTTFQAWVDGPINEIFLLIGYFLQVLLALLYIDMASRTRADTAAIVVEVYVKRLCELQNRLIREISANGLWRNVAVFELKCNFCHIVTHTGGAKIIQL